MKKKSPQKRNTPQHTNTPTHIHIHKGEGMRRGEQASTQRRPQSVATHYGQEYMPPLQCNKKRGAHNMSQLGTCEKLEVGMPQEVFRAWLPNLADMETRPHIANDVLAAHQLSRDHETVGQGNHDLRPCGTKKTGEQGAWKVRNKWGTKRKKQYAGVYLWGRFFLEAPNHPPASTASPHCSLTR